MKKEYAGGDVGGGGRKDIEDSHCIPPSFCSSSIEIPPWMLWYSGRGRRGSLKAKGGVAVTCGMCRGREDIQVGDAIITSGMEGIFPKGLSLGEVVKVVKKDYGLFQEIEIIPSVHFSRLEEVMVIVSPMREREG